MNTLNISVVIPNYNGAGLLRTHLPHVVKAAEKKENNIKEIIVVDDASTDESIEILKKEFPEVKVVKHSKNRRFSAAVNTGARTAEGNIICLLNSDVSPESNFLKNIPRHFKDEKVFGVSFGEKGYSWARGFFKDGFVEHKPGKLTDKPHKTFWVSGGSGVFRRDIWMKLKGMDEKLYPPFYWEDLDLSYRAMKRGWKLVWEPTARVSHEHESTNKSFKSSYKSRIQERNQLLFIWRNITSGVLTRKHVRGLLTRIIKHPGYVRIVLMAALKLPAVLTLRRVEKREASVSDESIFAQF